jgi:hypothetical protein
LVPEDEDVLDDLVDDAALELLDPLVEDWVPVPDVPLVVPVVPVVVSGVAATEAVWVLKLSSMTSPATVPNSDAMTRFMVWFLLPVLPRVRTRTIRGAAVGAAHVPRATP